MGTNFGSVVLAILALLTGCGVFIIGIHLMSSGLQFFCSKKNSFLYRLFNVKNRFAGVACGAIYTGITQSSSATTVFVVSMVNAGIISLIQGASIIFGANIGTTITSFIVSFSAFDIAPYLSFFAFVGSIMMISGGTNVRRVGQILAGFGSLFIGMTLLESSFNDSIIRDAIIELFQLIKHPLLLLLTGILVTALLQSSSITSSVVIFMVGSDLIPLDYGLYIVIGANVGTCITAIISSLGSSVNAKRASMIHLLFNVIGAGIALAVVWGFNDQVNAFFDSMNILPQFKIALFHLLFNVVTALVLLPFLKPIAILSTKLVRKRVYVPDYMER